MSQKILTATIVIPVKNGQGNILKTLRSLIKQSHLPCEVIVIDDCSTDDTWEVLTSFKENNLLPFTFLLHRMETDSLGSATARNYGISCVSSELIVFLDSDCVADKSWLFNLTRPLLNPSTPAELVGTGGKCKTYYKDFIGEFFEMMSIYRNPSDLTFLINANCCYRKNILELIGGFKEDMYTSEDAEIGVRLRHLGFCFEYVPNAIVYNHFPSEIRILTKKFRGYGAMDYLVYKTEKSILLSSKDMKKLFYQPSLFFKRGEMLFRQVNLFIIVHFLKKTPVILNTFRHKNILFAGNSRKELIKTDSFPKKIIFIFLTLLARFSYWQGFISQYRYEYKLSN